MCHHKHFGKRTIYNEYVNGEVKNCFCASDAHRGAISDLIC